MDFRKLTYRQVLAHTQRVCKALGDSGTVLEPYYRFNDFWPVIYARVLVPGLGEVPITIRADTIENIAEKLEKESQT